MAATPSHVLFVFLDGVGLGSGGTRNPLTTHTWPALEELAGGQPWAHPYTPIQSDTHVFRGIDATLGVEGLPQSGTGQATLFTGINAALLAERHFGPYPHSKTRDAIREQNVFRRIAALFPSEPEPAIFANAYPPRFFAYCAERDRWTVTTRCCLDAGVRIRTMDDLRTGQALAADLTNAGLHHLGIDVPVRTPAESGTILVDASHRHLFTLFEYYLTDKAGHSRDHERAASTLRDVDEFLGAILRTRDPERDLLIISSDHGNLENLEVKTHTLNPAPLVAIGPGASAFADVTDLTGVVPALVGSLGK